MTINQLNSLNLDQLEAAIANDPEAAACKSFAKACNILYAKAA